MMVGVLKVNKTRKIFYKVKRIKYSLIKLYD